jgi:hypothetical protein
VNSTITTDSSGFYSFDGLRPSDAQGYTVTESQPAGLLDGKDTRGNVSPLPGSAGSDVISGIILPPGAAATENNFGELRPASLAGMAFRDDDNSGAQNGAEPGLVGVTVTLTGTDDLGGPVSQSPPRHLHDHRDAARELRRRPGPSRHRERHARQRRGQRDRPQ